MKKRIFIALIIIVACAAIALPLYFFVFKKNDMRQEQAVDLITRAAIDMGALEEYEGSPNIDGINTDSGDNNVINTNNLPSISDITLSQQTLNTNDSYYIDITSDINIILKTFYSFMKIENLEQNKIYQSTASGETSKVSYKIIKNEIIFIDVMSSDTENYESYFSFFYDNTDNEYEFINVVKNVTSGDYTIIRFKANSEGLISCEYYVLSGVININVLTGIQDGEGTSSVVVYDVKNQTTKTATFTKLSSADSHFVLSSYIYQVYSNFNEVLGEDMSTVKASTDATIADFLPAE